MRQYLIEGATGGVPFLIDRSKPIVFEARAEGQASARIPGRFSVCDCVNGNNRRYSKRVWEKNLAQGSVLTESMKRNAAFGLLEHPKDGIVTLLSPISHHVTEAKLEPAVDNTGRQIWEVHGTIEILETPEGRKLKALIEGGYNPLVSSRGYGSLEKAADGVDEVCEDYICEGWDVVIKPSFETAELTPSRPESKQNPSRQESQNDPQPKRSPVVDCAIAESATGISAEPPKTDLKASPSTPARAEENAAASSKTQAKTMEINEIKGRITALRTAVESCPPDPNRISEIRESIDEAGREVSQFAAADPAKNNWDARKLHRELESMSTRLGETASAPAKQAKKLSENNLKLMKVVNAVAQTAMTYKKKLGEALKAKASATKMVEELTRRGQGWQQLAESRKGKLLRMEDDFDTACKALDIMTGRYHEDVTELGRRIIVLEFREKAQAAEIQKQLKEATRLRHIAAIRETLEGKKPAKTPVNEEGVGKPKEGETPTMAKKEGEGKGEKGEQVAKEPGDVKHESKEGEGDGKPKQSLSEAKILLRERDPRSVTESFEMVRRLSTTAK